MILQLIDSFCDLLERCVPPERREMQRGEVLVPTWLNPKRILRSYLSFRYLKGQGLEIGALHQPLATSWRAKVSYVDYLSLEGLRAHYPELQRLPLVSPDIVDNGEYLDKVSNQSQDFIIANHFLEHTQDPIGTLERHLSKLKVGGYLYLAVPVRDYTFDRARELTSLEHLLSDYQNGAEASRAGHYQEWVQHVEGVQGSAAIAERQNYLLAQSYSIHFHVWNPQTFLQFLTHLHSVMKFPFVLKEFVHSRHNPQEVIAMLRRV